MALKFTPSTEAAAAAAEEVVVTATEEKTLDVKVEEAQEFSMVNTTETLKQELVKNEEVETVVNPLEEENAKLKEEISSLNAKVEEVQADYLRARADCENVRKRKGEEVRKAYEDGKVETVEKILGIGDSLDWALKMPLDEKTKEGIEMLLKKYHETH